jgi:hypothetical protein
MGMGTRLAAALSLGLAVAATVPAVAGAQARSDVWDAVAGSLPAAKGGSPADIRPSSYRAFRLDQSGLEAGLKAAPKAGPRSAAPSGATTLTLPAPTGGFQRFEVYEAPIMEPKLAALHPDIKTYAGRGIDDPTATIRADTSAALGFHASVRAPDGAWYIDPYYRNDDSVYVSYFGRDLSADEPFVERCPDGDPGPLDLGLGQSRSAAAGPSVQLRTYRLALLTDPDYSTYFGGPANVTAAKVTLINRVDQVYEDETAIRLVLIGDNDKLNLNTPAQMTGANGPCGAAACFTAAQASTCGGGTLDRNRIVIGQIVGAANYDVGHIALGVPGGGVAQLGVIGQSNKARGCTGLATPVGDYFAVDYVAHEMGHQFAGNHTFNGTQRNCSGGNRSAGASVEPGSGSSIMAYAGICDQDNLQPHSDPYWSQRSYDEITALVTGARADVTEVQNVSLRDFDGTDSLTLTFKGATVGPFVRGTNYSAADLQGALGGQEVQNVVLGGYDANGDAYTLTYKGAKSHPIVRGQNNTAAGVANAIAGGNEVQQVALSAFNGTNQSFQIQIGGQTTPAFGIGGTAISNANIAAAINALTGFAGTATVSGANNNGFGVTFAGPLAGTDVAPISIVNCTGTCTSSVRENAKGGPAPASWPAGATVTVGTVTDAGYNLLFGGTLAGTDVDPFTVSDATGATGAVTESTKGGAGILGAGGTAAVAGLGGGAFDDAGFQVTFGGTLAGLDQPSLEPAVTGGSGFVGETAHGGPANNKGFIIVDTGNHAPDVTAPAAYTIPPRTPFSLTGSATDPDGDPVTYLWEQNDRGGLPAPGSTAGTALVNQVKTNGPLFRVFGKAADVSATDTLKYRSPGENAVTTNPTRVFPDMEQILANNTNAATGTCPTPPPAPAALPAVTRECFSEWLPTSDWIGFLGDRTLNFRLTARDSKPGGGAIGFASTKVTVAPLAGPFRVTSHAVSQVLYGTLAQTITWDVAGTDVSPIDAGNVRISLISDQGETVIAESTPNDGSYAGVWPNVAGTHARVKVAAVGNVFFDVSDADLTSAVAPTAPVGGTVPATLALALGAPANFGPFTPGAAKEYTASTTATVVSSAGDATLTVADPSSTAPGHLVNGAFSLPQPLQGLGVVKTWAAPTSNESVPVTFKQAIGAGDALRTGTYSKTLTFTLSTTTP